MFETLISKLRRINGNAASLKAATAVAPVMRTRIFVQRLATNGTPICGAKSKHSTGQMEKDFDVVHAGTMYGIGFVRNTKRDNGMTHMEIARAQERRCGQKIYSMSDSEEALAVKTIKSLTP